ncbi:cilia- and flagella-associated protein HOATZ-like isoform X2 [Physella acuta]|uniref:cilia- and flagella-associated protein HOATZ-like isoform X2 n=1 Tax=Physella acuta TaxID=109671 RepID=UPI0027DD1902|nr:cilia- and flagella-associated protein HOATZ-like isoform X2 [Physella acuta]
MAIKLIDLTKQQEKCSFTESTPEEIAYAETFWQSIKLQPTMESRLVSSDIKQRLGIKKHSSKSSIETVHKGKIEDQKLQQVFTRAHAYDQLREFARLRELAEARNKERETLHRRRDERIKKEAAIKEKVKKSGKTKDDEKEIEPSPKWKIGEAYSIHEMYKDIAEFDEKIEKVEAERKRKRQYIMDVLCATIVKDTKEKNPVKEELMRKKSIKIWRPSS